MAKSPSSHTPKHRARKASASERGAHRKASAASVSRRKADKLKAPPAPHLPAPQSGSQTSPTKLAILLELLRRPGGVTLAEMMRATGWQAHSVRGAMAGALTRRGIPIDSAKADGVRRYNASAAAIIPETT